MVNHFASLEKIKEAEISALIDLAIRSNSSGDEELKIGQTKMKSVMVYFLVRTAISHLGNNDRMELSAQPITPKAAWSPAITYFEPGEHPNCLYSSRLLEDSNLEGYLAPEFSKMPRLKVLAD